MVKDNKSGQKRRLDRKKECIARPKMWRRKRHYRRVVFSGMKDKKGRVYVKTPGGLRRGDLMKNRYGRIVGKRQHAQGKKAFKSLKPYADARVNKIRELGATGFVKAKQNGTETEIAVYMAMMAAKQQETHEKMRRAAENLARLQANRASASTAPPVEERPPPVVPAPVRPPGDVYAPGDEVALHGLVSMQELNGQVGIILSFDKEEPGRYAVKLRAVGEKPAAHVHVKPANVRPSVPL